VQESPERKKASIKVPVSPTFWPYPAYIYLFWESFSTGSFEKQSSPPYFLLLSLPSFCFPIFFLPVLPTPPFGLFSCFFSVLPPYSWEKEKTCSPSFPSPFCFYFGLIHSPSIPSECSVPSSPSLFSFF